MTLVADGFNSLHPTRHPKVNNPKRDSARQDNAAAPPDQAIRGEYQSQPVSIADAADRLVRACTETHNTKVAVFQAFCAAFEETAKQFTTQPERDLAQHLSASFLGYWRETLAAPNLTSRPTYSSVAASSSTSSASPTPASEPRHRQHQQQQQHTPPDLQGQRAAAAPPTYPAHDLRVFARLGAEAPARAQTSYAIRTHVAQKTGISPQSIHAIPVASGWAIRPADVATRDSLLRQKDDWSRELGATAVEASEKWYKYVVRDCPRRLTDLQGNVADYEAAARDEIECQPAFAPVRIATSRHDSDDLPTKTLIVSFTSPTKRFWTLFGASAPAKLVDKTLPPKQCVTCWDYHTRRDCRRLPVCESCGKDRPQAGGLPRTRSMCQLLGAAQGHGGIRVPGATEEGARHATLPDEGAAGNGSKDRPGALPAEEPEIRSQPGTESTGGCGDLCSARPGHGR
jgi:hypothetical protein